MRSVLLNTKNPKVILLSVMNTIQANLIDTFTLTKLSPGPTHYTNNKWDSSFIKKFTTTKWPLELYKGSLLNDFLSLFFSHVH